MRINVSLPDAVQFGETLSCLVVPVFKGDFPINSSLLRQEEELALQALIDWEVFRGGQCETPFLPAAGAPYQSVLLLGLGERGKETPESVRRAAGTAARTLLANRVSHVVLDLSHFEASLAEPVVEAVILGQYDFDVYKQRKKGCAAPQRVEAFTVVVKDGVAEDGLRSQLELAALCCFSANGARHLANTPPNEMNPAALASFAQGIAQDSGCECVVLGERQMETLGLRALLAVGQGSQQDSQLIILRHHVSNDARTLCIVGKGVTFDTGGISIKPSQDMHEMKYDMAGAAAVLCAMMTIVELRPPINVICVVPTVENMPSGNSLRPGDIIKAYNGKTIAVQNTDAEGRLILADAMSYVADKYKPDVIVDLATLTGACVVALGHNAAGLFSNSEELTQQLLEASERTGERIWPMPLWDEHSELLKSPHADLSNVGPRWGGAISAAAFLKEFIGETQQWAHLDIAGTAWGAKHLPYASPDHASGFGVRLLVRWILEQAQGA